MQTTGDGVPAASRHAGLEGNMARGEKGKALGAERDCQTLSRAPRRREKKSRFIDDAASASGTASSDEDDDEEANEADKAFIHDDTDESDEEELPTKRVRISRREKRLTKNDLKLVLENVGLLQDNSDDKKQTRKKHTTTVYKDSDESGMCSSDEGFIETESSDDEEETPKHVAPAPKRTKKKAPQPSSKKQPPTIPAVPSPASAPAAEPEPEPALLAMTTDQLSDFNGFYSCDAAGEDSEIPPSILLAPPPALVKPPAPPVARHSYVTQCPLAPPRKENTSGTFPKKKPMAPPGRVKPTPQTRAVAPIFNKDHRPLPPPLTKKAADAKKKRAGGGFGDQPQEGIYMRNGQLYYKDKDGNETPRNWNP